MTVHHKGLFYQKTELLTLTLFSYDKRPDINIMALLSNLTFAGQYETVTSPSNTSNGKNTYFLDMGRTRMKYFGKSIMHLY